MIKNPYKLFENYILRTPLYSLNIFKDIFDKQSINEKTLKEFVSLNEFKESVYLASPNFTKQIEKWINNDIKDEKKEILIRNSILKYISRITTRCTPFGLFALCSVGSFSSETDIKLHNKREHKRFTRFDMTIVEILCNELSRKIELKNMLRFFVNSSLYSTGKQYRYIKYKLDKGHRIYSLEGVNKTSYLDNLINVSWEGKKIDELSSILTSEGFERKESEQYIDLLIENQILIPELQATITGKNNFDKLIALIESYQLENDSIINELKVYNEQLKSFDQSFFNNTITKYNEFSNNVQHFIKSPISEKPFIQTDAKASLKNNTLSIDIQRQFKDAMTILNKISFPYERERMAVFKRRFKNRYESEQIPLCLALDSELGIGYDHKRNDSNPLIDDIKLAPSKKHYKTFVWSDTDELLLKKTLTALKKNQKEIKLNERDFEGCEVSWDDLPDSMSAIVEATYTNEGVVQLFFDGIGGTSGANLMSRFGHLDSSIHDFTKKITSIEQKAEPDKIIAEIVHLPKNKTGNVIQRSTQRNYEIPYLGKSSLPIERQININDIMISLKGNKLVLRSKRLNREIIPKLTNAHTANTLSLPIYRFLYDMQTQNKRGGIGLAWHELFNSFSFLPRVTYKNIIFSKAKWRINKTNLKQFYDCKDDLELKKQFSLWSQKLRLHKYVQLVERDQTILVDIQNIDSVKMLLSSVKNKKSFILEEFLFSEKAIVTDTNNENYCNQFVISVYNHEKLKVNELKNG